MYSAIKSHYLHIIKIQQNIDFDAVDIRYS